MKIQGFFMSIAPALTIEVVDDSKRPSILPRLPVALKRAATLSSAIEASLATLDSATNL